MRYTIGEMGKIMGVPTSTLRYYDKEGLLPFVERSSGGMRVFSGEDLEWLYIIDCLKKTGMPLKDIKAYIDWATQGDGTIDQRLDLLRKRRENVEEQIRQLNGTLALLDYKCWYYEMAKAAGTTDAPKSMDRHEVPQEYQEVKKRLDDYRGARQTALSD